MVSAILCEAVRNLFASRWFRVTALLWVVGFFVVFVPAHRRGIVTLAACQTVSVDGEAQAPAKKPYCPLCTTWTSAGGDSAPADAPVNCAICHLKANLDLPPAIILAPAFVAELEFLIQHYDAVESPLLAPQRSLHGRAPPVI